MANTRSLQAAEKQLTQAVARKSRAQIAAAKADADIRTLKARIEWLKQDPTLGEQEVEDGGEDTPPAE